MVAQHVFFWRSGIVRVLYIDRESVRVYALLYVYCTLLIAEILGIEKKVLHNIIYISQSEAQSNLF